MTGQNSLTESLLRRANLDGIETFLDGHGSLRIRGDTNARQRWKPTLKQHKNRIIEFLKLEPQGFAPPAKKNAACLTVVAPMTDNEHSLILEWLGHIGEHDPVVVAEVVAACQTRVLDRDYFLRRAWADLPEPEIEADDRIKCHQCANLLGGQCDAVTIGTFPRITKQFKPDPTVLRRCAWFETIPGSGRDINQPCTKEST